MWQCEPNAYYVLYNLICKIETDQPSWLFYYLKG